MGLNYVSLLDDYRFMFEGVPDPIFYKDLYPTSWVFEDLDAKVGWPRYNFVDGLKYLDNVEHEKSTKRKERMEEYSQSYRRILRSFVAEFLEDNPSIKIGVLAVPSSSAGVNNQATLIVNDVVREMTTSREDRRLIDLTSRLKRTRDKAAAHEDGPRAIQPNVETLEFRGDIPADVSALIVVDDVVTTGQSFVAVSQALRSAGYKGSIINFAFSRSMNWQAHKFYDAWNTTIGKAHHVETNTAGPIKAIVFDLDQTLIDSSKRNARFEQAVNKLKTNNRDRESDKHYLKFLPKCDGIYEVYDADDLEEFQRRSDIPFAILSNSGHDRLRWIWQLKSIQRRVYPNVYDSHEDHSYVFSTRDRAYIAPFGERYYVKRNPRNRTYRYTLSCKCPANLFGVPKDSQKDGESDRTVLFQKPNPKGCECAINWLKGKFRLSEEARIVGVGNTPEDIIAYRAAGLESALALWGVPRFARDYARRNWGADHNHETMSEFLSWVEKQKGGS